MRGGLRRDRRYRFRAYREGAQRPLRSRARSRQRAALRHASASARLLAPRPGSRCPGRRGPGLPARVIPVLLQHMAATGIDVWLAALASGASNVVVLASGAEAPQYAYALERQMAFAESIAQALGYQGPHFKLLRAVDA